MELFSKILPETAESTEKESSLIKSEVQKKICLNEKNMVENLTARRLFCFFIKNLEKIKIEVK